MAKHRLRLLVADDKGTVIEHPRLLAAVRSGEESCPPRGSRSPSCCPSSESSRTSMRTHSDPKSYSTPEMKQLVDARV
jgi:hypothetical protein